MGTEEEPVVAVAVGVAALDSAAFGIDFIQQCRVLPQILLVNRGALASPKDSTLADCAEHCKSGPKRRETTSASFTLLSRNDDWLAAVGGS